MEDYFELCRQIDTLINNYMGWEDCHSSLMEENFVIHLN